MESRNLPLISVNDDSKGVVYNLEGSKRSREEIEKIQTQEKEKDSSMSDDSWHRHLQRRRERR